MGRYGKIAGVVASLMLACTAQRVAAFEIATPIERLQLRWDNTVRYNAAWRVQDQDPALLANASLDDGNRNFDRGLISSRFDLLSEFDAVYDNAYAIRFSGAAWYDAAYDGTLDNRSPQTSNHLDGNGMPAVGLSRAAERYGRGPTGELLDAFAAAVIDVGEVPVAVKAGRLTVYWGESLLLGGAAHGVSYSQMPVDVAKGLSVPGTEVKELFRPLASVSLQSQLLPSLSVAGQYFFEWEPFRLPEAGTYLDLNNALQEGGETVILLDGVRVTHARDVEPDQRGNWGASLRWSPDALDGTLGVYYRRFADMMPQVFVVPDVAELDTYGTGCAIAGTYAFNYPGGIDLYGLTLSKSIAGVSVGVELSYRENMPLISEPAVLLTQPLPAALQPVLNELLAGLRQLPLPAGAPAIPAIVVGPVPREGEAVGARGNTMHAVVNALGLINRVEPFGLRVIDGASWIVELAWSRWDSVSDNENLFKGRDDYRAIDRVTRDNLALGVNFTPVWYQVLAGVDLLLPMSYSVGLYGNSAVQLGGNESAGTASIGLSADIFSRYRIDLKYAEFFGDYATDADGAATVPNGATAALSDRGFVSLTLKTTF